jgi:hypothetical protein
MTQHVGKSLAARSEKFCASLLFRLPPLCSQHAVTEKSLSENGINQS